MKKIDKQIKEILHKDIMKAMPTLDEEKVLASINFGGKPVRKNRIWVYRLVYSLALIIVCVVSTFFITDHIQGLKYKNDNIESVARDEFSKVANKDEFIGPIYFSTVDNVIVYGVYDDIDSNEYLFLIFAKNHIKNFTCIINEEVISIEETLVQKKLSPENTISIIFKEGNVIMHSIILNI